MTVHLKEGPTRLATMKTGSFLWVSTDESLKESLRDVTEHFLETHSLPAIPDVERSIGEFCAESHGLEVDLSEHEPPENVEGRVY